MSRFWRTFAVWYSILLVFFVLANLAGFVQDTGLLPFRRIGFPWLYAVWRFRANLSIDWIIVVWNAGFALVVSIPIAMLCALARTRQRRGVSS